MNDKFQFDISVAGRVPLANDVPINYDELDSECVELVRFFNQQGLQTRMCCQGHNDTNQSIFYVEFDKDIVLDDVVDFQQRFLDSRGSFCSCGHFGKRVFMCSDSVGGSTREGTIFEMWEYVAASPVAAKQDLERWRSMLEVTSERIRPEFFEDYLGTN